MEITKPEEETPKENEKKKWNKPTLYSGKEIGFQIQTTGPTYTPS